MTEHKKDLRQQMRARLHDISTAKRQQESAEVCARLVKQDVWRKACAILFFAPRPDEMDILPLLEHALAAGKIAALPRYVSETGAYAASQINHFTHDCAPGKFGIPEPSAHCPVFPLNRLDLALVPGLAFDLTGHRLGRGNGYYDRILAEVTGIRCGVAFDEQLVESIPMESHDIALNCVLTPSRWVEIPGRPAIR